MTSMGRLAFALAAGALVMACGQKQEASAPAIPPGALPADDPNAPAVPPVAPVDYSKAGAWLCRPETVDACEQAATATAIAPDGTLTKDNFAPDPDAPIDCFYIYPTVSRDQLPNSDTMAGPEEQEIARQQLARFGSVCRLYAPMYRQVTLSALNQMMAGEKPPTDREMAYADVKAAWERYLANDNGGRGVVLIGHSQGAGLLARLIAAEIDGRPAQDKLVSAILPGTNLAVGDMHDGGGAFNSIRLCQSAVDLSCAISWASFRATPPPPADSLFGRVEEEGVSTACVNPAQLDGSNGELKAILPAGAFSSLTAPPGSWTADNAEIETPFVRLPGLLSARCVNRDGFNYLAVSIAADPLDPRTDTITGDMMIDGRIQPSWGLHPADINLALGNLVEIVRRQGAEWVRTHAPASPASPASTSPTPTPQ